MKWIFFNSWATILILSITTKIVINLTFSKLLYAQLGICREWIDIFVKITLQLHSRYDFKTRRETFLRMICFRKSSKKVLYSILSFHKSKGDPQCREFLNNNLYNCNNSSQRWKPSRTFYIIPISRSWKSKFFLFCFLQPINIWLWNNFCWIMLPSVIWGRKFNYNTCINHINFVGAPWKKRTCRMSASYRSSLWFFSTVDTNFFHETDF